MRYGLGTLDRGGCDGLQKHLRVCQPRVDARRWLGEVNIGAPGDWVLLHNTRGCGYRKACLLLQLPLLLPSLGILRSMDRINIMLARVMWQRWLLGQFDRCDQ